MAFYTPDSAYIGKTPVIYYPDESIADVRPVESRSLEAVLQEVVAGHQDAFPPELDYVIVFISSQHGDVYVDARVFRQTDKQGQWPAPSVRAFRNGRTLAGGIENSAIKRIVIDIEELHRRRSRSLAEYVLGPRPDLPPALLRLA